MQRESQILNLRKQIEQLTNDSQALAAGHRNELEQLQSKFLE